MFTRHKKTCVCIIMTAIGDDAARHDDVHVFFSIPCCFSILTVMVTMHRRDMMMHSLYPVMVVMHRFLVFSHFFALMLTMHSTQMAILAVSALFDFFRPNADDAEETHDN